MAVFVAKIANLIGWGEVTTRRGEGWTRNKFRMKLDGHSVTIVQRAKVLKMKWTAARGRFIESSTVRVSDITTFAEGEEFVEDLCALISFAKHTRVAPYEFKFGNRTTAKSVVAACNEFRPPFASGVGKLTDFVAQAWLAYRKQKETRALRQLIHMITLSDADGAALETKVTMSMQCLESIKSYFAICEGSRFGIEETKEGRFVDATGRDVSFRKLLTLTLHDVGMTLPATFSTIVKVRNVIMHRGFIRETDKVAQHIFGKLQPGAIFDAIFKVMEQVQDVLREFVFRMLNYKGPFLFYADAGSGSKVLV